MALPKAFIFDLDGTLVDSEPHHFGAYKETLEKYGGNLSLREFIDTWLNMAGGMTGYIQRHGLYADPDIARKEKSDLFLKRIENGLNLFPGVKEIIEFMDANGIKRAIATGSHSREGVTAVGKAKLNRDFPVVVAFDHVMNPKPHPDVYLACAKALKVRPDECIAFENATIGVKSAKAAGMACIAVPSEYTRNMDLSEADLILNSLEEFNEDVMRKLIYNTGEINK